MKESPVVSPLTPSPMEPSNCLSLPLIFLPSIFNLRNVLSSKSPLSMCPIHFPCLFLIVRILLQSYVLSNWCSPFFFISTLTADLPCFLQSSCGHTEISMSWFIFLQPSYPSPDPLLSLWQDLQCRYQIQSRSQLLRRPVGVNFCSPSRSEKCKNLDQPENSN